MVIQPRDALLDVTDEHRTRRSLLLQPLNQDVAIRNGMPGFLDRGAPVTVDLLELIYPSERERIPGWVMAGLLGRLEREMRTPPPKEKTCQGTLLSREQYLPDVQRWGLTDVRHTNASSMTTDDVVLWTQAIDDSKKE